MSLTGPSPRLQELCGPLLREGVSVEDLFQALREADSQDLAAVVRDATDRYSVEPGLLDLFAPQPTATEAPPPKRKAPSVPFVVDNVIYSPDDIARFDGSPLNFIYRHDALLVGVAGAAWLQTLTTYVQLRRLLLLAPLGGVGSSGQYPPGPSKGSAGSRPVVTDLGPPTGFFEDVTLRGAQLQLSANRVWPDLTQVHSYVNSAIGRFEGKAWNDRIRSFWSQGETLLMFEHIQFQGDTLLSWEHNFDLGQIGWSNRISSIKNFGHIY